MVPQVPGPGPVLVLNLKFSKLNSLNAWEVIARIGFW